MPLYFIVLEPSNIQNLVTGNAWTTAAQPTRMTDRPIRRSPAEWILLAPARANSCHKMLPLDESYEETIIHLSDLENVLYLTHTLGQHGPDQTRKKM